MLSGLLIFSCAMMPVAALANGDEDKPLYEIEAFAIGGYTPDYPGAAQNHLHAIASPWLAYRGEYLRTEENGSISGRLVHSQRFELGVSVSGSFPSDSKDNTARSGMTRLDWMGELGPRARLNLYYLQNHFHQ
ncbi:MAG: MipA/OmpV family protein [Alphaproteobacteria bacterium]|nr:MipA/OmpV family protein [Alphaproteobacteria bacterium]